MGFDLNRHWLDPSPWAHPTLHGVKQLIIQMYNDPVSNRTSSAAAGRTPCSAGGQCCSGKVHKELQIRDSGSKPAVGGAGARPAGLFSELDKPKGLPHPHNTVFHVALPWGKGNIPEQSTSVRALG